MRDFSPFTATGDVWTPEECRLFDLPVPEQTNTYKPISYERGLSEMWDELEKLNLQVVSRRYVPNKDASQLITYFNIAMPGHDAYQMMIGQRNSYNKSMRLGLVSGANVFICGNGCIFGDVKYAQKHVGEVQWDFPVEIERHVNYIGEQFSDILERFRKLQHIPLTKREMAELAGRMFIEDEVISANELSKLKDEILVPTFDYSTGDYVFKNDDAFGLYQASTLVLKDAHPYHNDRKLRVLSEFFDKSLFEEAVLVK